MVDTNVRNMDTDFSIPITQIRTKLRTLLMAPGIAKRTGGSITVNNEIASVIGVPTNANYPTEDAFVDAVLHSWFPQAFGKAA